MFWPENLGFTEIIFNENGNRHYIFQVKNYNNVAISSADFIFFYKM
jgi:hypothetical protein